MTESPRHAYSLSALFVLMTASATLVAGVTPLLRLATKGDFESLALLVAGAIGLVAGALLGLVVGLLQFRRRLGALVGTAAGGIIGIVAALFALMPPEVLGPAGLALLVGSGLIVGVALVNRRVNA
ncbi:MAG: hypothetical protein SFU86_02955 [Pirellulaceae bacterium]|nr:hypothetical protein [Pirellulaceae bacterium]